jgi:hypothetical protein
VIPKVAEGSSEKTIAWDLASTGIAAKDAVTDNKSVARRIIVPAGLLPNVSDPANPAQSVNEECDAENHLDNRIIPPLICIARFRHDTRHRRAIASFGPTYSNVFRVEASRDGHICT